MLLRDTLYTTAWFGLMSMVWFGWAQEAPPRQLRVSMIVGSVLGAALAIGFGVLTAIHWGNPTALEGRYEIFGIIVGAEVAVAGAGAAAFGLTGHGRWMAWWVAVVVAAHFVSLAWVLHGPWLAVLGVVQLVALAVLVPVLRGSSDPTSRWVGPVMGLTLLLYAVLSGAAVLRRLTDA